MKSNSHRVSKPDSRQPEIQEESLMPQSPLPHQEALMKATQNQDWALVSDLSTQVLVSHPNEQRHIYLLAKAKVNLGDFEGARLLLPQLDQNLRNEIENLLNKDETK